MKLLVNNPSGGQEIVNIGDGGAYFDPKRVLWDERDDGPMPIITLGGMTRVGDALVLDKDLLTAAKSSALAAAKAAAVVRIDADADAIRSAVIGQRATEYQTALEQAQAYVDASYAGAVPSYVKSWVDAKAGGGVTWTGKQAADDILVTGTAWLGAEAAIRAARLLRKEQARAAADLAAVTTIMSAWAGFVAAIRVQLGLGR